MTISETKSPDIRVRFAPSPSGHLHLGHAFSAVHGYELAKQLGGQWHIRIEDIDTTRCKPEFIQSILNDMEWLGLAQNSPPTIQTANRAAHAAALDQLTQRGLTYPCFCTRADIAEAAGAPHGAPAIYPGTCRNLPPEEAQRRALTTPHAIRLNIAKAVAITGDLFWQELNSDGQIQSVPADALAGGDMVLTRKDIGIGYLLSCVVDDGAEGVTHILRGRDLWDSTPAQRVLQVLLNLPAPIYLHHRLLLAADGRRLAKRDKAETLQSLRLSGIDGKLLKSELLKLPTHGDDCFLPLNHLYPRQL